MTEPYAWESMTPGYTRWIADSRYRRLRSAYQRWYRPICPNCGPKGIAQNTPFLNEEHGGSNVAVSNQ